MNPQLVQTVNAQIILSVVTSPWMKTGLCRGASSLALFCQAGTVRPVWPYLDGTSVCYLFGRK